MFPKLKHYGTINGRECADGRSQREYSIKAETSSLPLLLELMLMSSTIDTKEGRYVVVTDIQALFCLGTWSRMYI